VNEGTRRLEHYDYEYSFHTKIVRLVGAGSVNLRLLELGGGPEKFILFWLNKSLIDGH